MMGGVDDGRVMVVTVKKRHLRSVRRAGLAYRVIPCRHAGQAVPVAVLLARAAVLFEVDERGAGTALRNQ
jgi:hypothetical protein